MTKSSMVGCLVFSFAVSAMGLTFDRNVTEPIKQQFLSDLEFISQIEMDHQTPLHQQVFQTPGGQSYRTFFESRVKKVGMDSCGSANAVACVIPFWSNTTIWLTENFVKFEHPAVARLMIVFHEARHTERANSNWFHATCPRPFVDKDGKEFRSIWTGAPLAGEPACDITPFGSYGSSTIMLKNISAYCVNCNEKVKMDADLYAMDQVNRITDAKARQQITEDFNATNPVLF